MNTRSCPRLVPILLLLLPLGLSAQSAPTPVSDTAPPDQTVKLNPFQVSATGDKGYGALYNMAGGRINQEALDEPSSVISINQALLQDLAPEQPIDALQWVSGVNNTIGEYSSEFTIRGFQIATYDFVDGLPGQSGISGDNWLDMAFIDRIEVVKGPAGVQYGATSLGGVVDTITKKPLPYDQVILSTAYGSWNTWRVTADVNYVGGTNNAAQFRLIYDWQDGENPMGGPQGQKGVNPTFSYNISDHAKVWARFAYIFTDSMYGLTSIVEDNHNNLSLMYHNGDVPLKDISGTESNEWEYQYEAGLSASVDTLGTTWNMRLVARYNTYWFDGDETNMTGVEMINSSGGIINTIANGGSLVEPGIADIQITRLERFEADHGHFANVDMDLVAKYDFGHTRDLIDFYNYLAYSYGVSSRINWFVSNQDLFNPVQYKNIFATLTGFDNDQINSASYGINYAAGLQNNLQLFDDRLILVAGSRWDWGYATSTNYLLATNLAQSQGFDSAFTFKYGVVGKPIPSLKGVALFWDHSETFSPQVGFLNNNPLTPERSLRGNMDEGGAKLELFNGLLTGTASAFSGTLTNQIIQPPGVNGVEPPQIQEGTNTTKGWEGDIDIEPLPQIALLLAYSNLDSKDPNGLYVRDVAEGASYKALGKYTFTNGAMQGFGVGYGYVLVSKHAGIAGATFVLPGYNYSQAFATYAHRNWRMQLNVNNIYNQIYAAGSTSNYEIYPGPPREIKLTFTYMIK